MSTNSPISDPEPILTIVGERVALGPLSPDLVPTITRWMNDPTTIRTLGPNAPGPLTELAESAWVETASREKQHLFVIRERETLRPIGTTDLREISYRNRSGSFGINIGERDARGKGFGTEATRLMLDHAFTVVGLHSVDLGVAAFNEAGIRAYTKAGFREVGRLRERWWFAGKLWDWVMMDCLATEFDSPVLGKIFSEEALRQP